MVCHRNSYSGHRRPGESVGVVGLAAIKIGKSDESAGCLVRQTIECEIVGLLDSRPGNARAGAYLRREAIPGAEIEIGVGQQVPAVNFVIGMVSAGRAHRVSRGWGVSHIGEEGVAALPIAWICER